MTLHLCSEGTVTEGGGKAWTEGAFQEEHGSASCSSRLLLHSSVRLILGYHRSLQPAWSNRINAANSLKPEDYISAPRATRTACRFLQRTHGADFHQHSPTACTREKHALSSTASSYRRDESEQTLPVRCGIYLARQTTIIPSVSQLISPVTRTRPHPAMK